MTRRKLPLKSAEQMGQQLLAKLALDNMDFTASAPSIARITGAGIDHTVQFLLTTKMQRLHEKAVEMLVC